MPSADGALPVHPLAAFALVCLPILAGCLDADDAPESFDELHHTCGARPEDRSLGGDHSLETIDYAIVSDGPFVVRVPVVLSPDGSTLEQWAANATPTADVSVVETEQGGALEISAPEGRRVIVCSLLGAWESGNGCCAERYLHGRWSTATEERRAQAIPVEVVAGTVSLDIDYHAESTWCSRDATFSAQAMGPGWHALAGSDRTLCE